MGLLFTAQDEVNGYNCSCAAGFTGQLCETNIDDCVMNPCENEGTCMVSHEPVATDMYLVCSECA